MSNDHRKEIEAFFPELNLIKNETLRTQIIALWEETMVKTGWEGKSLIRLTLSLNWPIEQYGNIIDHTRAVTRGAKAIGETLEELYGIQIDYDCLVAAGLLHDIGILEMFTLEGKRIVPIPNMGLPDHLRLGESIAKEGGMPSAVCHIIAAHSASYSETNPESAEAVILRIVDGVCILPLQFR